MHYSTIFPQLFNFIPKHRVEKSIEKRSGDRIAQAFYRVADIFNLSLRTAYGKDSLRKIENNYDRCCHLGMVLFPSRLVEAMNWRDPEMFKVLFEEISGRATLCHVLPDINFVFIIRCMPLTAEPLIFV